MSRFMITNSCMPRMFAEFADIDIAEATLFGNERPKQRIRMLDDSKDN